MRTIKLSLFHRLIAQAEEAELKGLTRVASALTTAATRNAAVVREDEDFYRYPRESFEVDINNELWQAVVRIADFHGIKRFDAEAVQQMIDKTAEQLTNDLCNQAGIRHPIGAHEDPVPGEQEVAIQVSDDE